MFKNCKNLLKASALSLLLGFTPDIFAQTVIFPLAAQTVTTTISQLGDNLNSPKDLVSSNSEKTSVLETESNVNHCARGKAEELDLYEILDRKDWVVTANSNCGMVAENVIDGNLESYWQANYDNKGEGRTIMPYVLHFDLGKAQKFCSFGYYARTDKEEGICKSYSIDVSNDDKSWTTMRSGELKMDNNKFVWTEFGKTAKARYVRFTFASNQAGDHRAAVSEFYLGYDGSKVTKEILGLPMFTTEESPIWYPVYFKKGGAFLEDKGDGNKMITAGEKYTDEQQWQFVGNEYGFIMKSELGNYVCFKDGRFHTTADRSKADVLEFIQHKGLYLEMRIMGTNNHMSLIGGGGAGRELGVSESGLDENAFQVRPVEIPEPELPVFSDKEQETWYSIQFLNGDKVIEDQGDGNSVRLAESNGSENQIWKLVGNQKHFQIVNSKGHYLVLSDEAEEEVGPAAEANPNPIRTMTTPYAQGFRLVKSGNINYLPSWEIQSNDKDFYGKSFGQYAGTEIGRTISLKEAGDNNNPIVFVGVNTGINHVNMSPEVARTVYSISGVRIDAEKSQLSKGIYIVNGKKVIVK